MSDLQDESFREALRKAASSYALVHQLDGAEYGVDLGAMDLQAAYMAGARFRDQYLRLMSEFDLKTTSNDQMA